MALTAKQRRFVDEYVIDQNATQAAIRAGYSSKSAESIGFENLSKPEIAAYLAERRQDMQERTEISADMVLQRWWAIATADPNDLVQYRRGCCRHCWGVAHQYQWTQGELDHARSEAIRLAKTPPDDAGGAGFDARLAPNPECPECGGEGRGKVHVFDTRRLTGAAKLLYAGVRVGKDGLEVKMRDQDKALENVARHLGMFKERVELTGKDGRPIQTSHVPLDLSKLTYEELQDLERLTLAAQSRGDSGGEGAA